MMHLAADTGLCIFVNTRLVTHVLWCYTMVAGAEMYASVKAVHKVTHVSQCIHVDADMAMQYVNEIV